MLRRETLQEKDEIMSLRARWASVILTVVTIMGCAVESEQEMPANTPQGEPWILVDPAPNEDGQLKVLVLHDMEGLSGQSDPRTFSYRNSEFYPEGREYLIGDVNAVIAGLFDGGADVVQVVDGHGSGSPEPDIILDRLDPRAEMYSRPEPFQAYIDLVGTTNFDAIAVVGMHAKTGSGGFASHTYTLGIGVRVNGQSITETELVGLSFGRAGVPVIFASGDDKLAADLATMPWIRYVTVKDATSASTANPYPVDEARAQLRAEAQAALEDLSSARVMQATLPFEATLDAVPPASLAALEGVPGISYDDGSVTFTADSFGAAYEGWSALIRVAMGGYSSVMGEVLRDLDPDAGGEYSARLFERWFDVESGRWTPPPRPAPPEGRTYYGYR
jgi:D-amino peptidase